MKKSNKSPLYTLCVLSSLICIICIVVYAMTAENPADFLMQTFVDISIALSIGLLVAYIPML